jgi:hypothetical protein
MSSCFHPWFNAIVHEHWGKAGFSERRAFNHFFANIQGFPPTLLMTGILRDCVYAEKGICSAEK